jgi:ATP-binding cassette subfamily F protein 3
MATIRSILEDLLCGIDADALDYFESMISEENSIDETSMTSMLSPFLQSYGLASDDDSANTICSEIYKRLRMLGISDQIDTNNTPVVLEKSFTLSEISKSQISDTEQASIDSLWGFDKIRIKKNDVLELTDAGSAKYERKAAKDQRQWLEELEATFVGDEDAGNQISSMTLPDFEGNSRENDIHVHNFNITFGGRILLEGADLRLIYGRRYGLVGRNGVG